LVQGQSNEGRDFRVVIIDFCRGLPTGLGAGGGERRQRAEPVAGFEDGAGLTEHIDAATRTRARRALRALLESGAGPRLRSRWRRVTPRGLLFACLGIVGGLAAGVLLAVGLVSYRLSLGPIALDSLNPRIAQSLEDRFNGDYTFQLGPTSLERGETGLGLTFQGVVIKDKSGRTLLVAPKGEVGLDLWDFALFSIRAKRLELVGVDLALTARPDGALSISAGQPIGETSGVSFDLPPTPESAAGHPSSIFASLGWGMINALTSQSIPIERLGVVHGRLTVDDATTGQKKQFDDVAIDFARKHGDASLKVSARSQAGPWSLSVQARGGSDGALDIEAHDLNFADILLGAGMRGFAFETDMPISFKLALQMNAERKLAAMDGKFSLGAGYFKLEDPDHEPMLIDEAGGELRWDPTAQKVLVQNVKIFEGETHIFFSGAVTPPAASDPAWRVDFASTDTVFAGERPGEQPIRIGESAFHARYFADEKRFVLDNFSIAGPDATGAMKAEVVATDQGPTLKLDMSIGRSPLTNLARLWPTFIAPEVRNWCIENIKGGELVAGQLSIDWDAAAFAAARQKRPVPPDSVHGTFSAHDVAAELLAGVPPMAGMEGGGVLTGHDVTIKGSRGFIDVGPGKRILASDISFIVPDTTPKPLNPAQASAHFQGGADALVELISRDPLKRFVGFQGDFSSAKGHFDGKLTVDLKLGKTARSDDAVVSADVALTNLQIDKFLGSERLDQASMTVAVDRGAIKIVSEGKLFGADASLSAGKTGPNDEGVAQIAFTLDDAARAKRGLSFGAGIGGPIAVKVKTPLGRTSSGDAELDLSRVSLDNLLPGLVKPAGKPAKATFAFRSDADSFSISNLAFESGGASIKGGAQFSSDGALISAKLTQLRLSPGDDLKAEVSAADSVWRIAVRGATLDARPVLKGLFATGGPPSEIKNYDLDLKVATVVGANRQALSQVDMTVARRDGALRQMRLNASVGGGLLTVRREEGGNLLIQGADAGALLKFFDFYTRMEKGAFDLIVRSGEGRQEGAINIKNFVLRNEPALRQLVTAGQTQASTGLKLDPDAAPFQKLTGQFSRSAGRIDLHNALIYDQQMGLTAQGFIDYWGDRVDLAGTFVPAYQLNNLFSHVPIVGVILGGGAHEGLFAINYRISGPASAPTLAVNPLSAVTPGFLRKIFGAFDGTAQPLDETEAAPLTRGFTAPDRAGTNLR